MSQLAGGQGEVQGLHTGNELCCLLVRGCHDVFASFGVYNAVNVHFLLFLLSSPSLRHVSGYLSYEVA